jgi:hypothetical protein
LHRSARNTRLAGEAYGLKGTFNRFLRVECDERTACAPFALVRQLRTALDQRLQNSFIQKAANAITLKNYPRPYGIVCSREGGAETTANDVTNTGGSACIMQLDQRWPKLIEQFACTITDESGRSDILVKHAAWNIRVAFPSGSRVTVAPGS